MAQDFDIDIAGLLADYVFLLGGLRSVSSYRLVNKLFDREGMVISGSYVPLLTFCPGHQALDTRFATCTSSLETGVFNSAGTLSEHSLRSTRQLAPESMRCLGLLGPFA